MMKRISVLLISAFPAFATAQDPAAQERADSIAIAGSLIALLNDSAVAVQRARGTADSILKAPVELWPEAPVLTDAIRQQLRPKIWLLYTNPGLRLRLTMETGRGDVRPSRDLVTASADSIRAFFRANGVDVAAVSFTEAAPGSPTPSPTRAMFEAQGELVRTAIPSMAASPPEPTKVERRLWRDGEERYRWGTVRVFYATDRQRSGDSDPESFYAGTREPNGAMEFGRVEVTVPRMHKPGVVERPVWYKLERSVDADRHVAIKRIDPLEQRAMHDSVRQALAGSGRKETLVFIHGYNVSFADAAMRTAQMTYDLGFDGAPILYSWPSRGSIFRYAADRENAEFSAQHLAAFLDSVIAISGSKNVHVIAHSMGNRVLTLALERMALQGRDTLLNNMVLAAADVDASRFEQQIAPRIRPLARRITIYMSGQDKALRASRILSSNLRLGEATSPMLVVNGAETIDASTISVDLLGHGYIGSAAAVIDDLLDLMAGRSPPRARLKPKQTQSGAGYWALVEGGSP